MLCFPNAKINLGLNVIEKRPDGFHNLETLFVPCVQYRDILEIVFAEEASMHQYGLPYDGEAKDNLCYKAYLLMAERYNIPPVSLHLFKQIPVGAGLGGGSADAAFTLLALNRLCNLNLTNETLSSLGAELGSDVPFFIYNKPMLASGRGEILEPYDDLNLDDYTIKVVVPPIHVSTKEAYSGITPHKGEIPLTTALHMNIDEWKDVLFNDFEKSIFEKYPAIAALKADFYNQGAVYSSMSGSGSAVYGIFRKEN